MKESILNSIKDLLGPDSDYDVFNNEILIQINTALSILTQVGVGPEEGFIVTGDNQTWQDFLGDRIDASMVKTYVYMKVKMAFDPPQNSYLLTSMKETCDEFENRLKIMMENS